MESLCIGIDLGGTFIKFGLLDSHHHLRGTLQLPTPNDRGPAGIIAEMVAGAQRVLAEHAPSGRDIVGVGIGAPGPLRISEGIVVATPNIAGMTNVPLRDEVAKGLDLPAVLENDANAAAYGEFLCGAGREARDLVLLTLGTGVGSGIVVDGKILHGAHEMGAELGHMMIVPDGEPCGCGQRGCLEAYCSATYLARRARQLIEEEGRDSALKTILAAQGELDAKDINEARRAGDELAAEVWQRGAYFLALGCVNICRIFDPDVIVLSGGLAKAGEDLMQPVLKHFQRMHWTVAEPVTRIAFSALGGDAGVIGAAGVAWQALAPADA